MVNIFNEHGIPTYFFKRCDMAVDLFDYLKDNLKNENNKMGFTNSTKN
jgi:hypothetical protein